MLFCMLLISANFCLVVGLYTKDEISIFSAIFQVVLAIAIDNHFKTPPTKD